MTRSFSVLLTLLALAVAAPASAGVFQTPAGGWGIKQPPVTAPRPRGDGFASSAGGSPNI